MKESAIDDEQSYARAFIKQGGFCHCFHQGGKCGQGVFDRENGSEWVEKVAIVF